VEAVGRRQSDLATSAAGPTKSCHCMPPGKVGDAANSKCEIRRWRLVPGVDEPLERQVRRTIPPSPAF
jgi:hypothetical protein